MDMLIRNRRIRKLEKRIEELEDANLILRESKISVSKAPSRWIDEIIEDLEEEEF